VGVKAGRACRAFPHGAEEIVLFFKDELKRLDHFLQSEIAVRHIVLLPRARSDLPASEGGHADWPAASSGAILP
jgi:hypothetical protein